MASRYYPTSAYPFAAEFIRGVPGERQPELVKAAIKLHRLAAPELGDPLRDVTGRAYERRWKRAATDVAHWVSELGHLQCAAGAIVHARGPTCANCGKTEPDCERWAECDFHPVKVARRDKAEHSEATR